MLDRLFGSEARVRVLSLFLTHPDCDFYEREIGCFTGLLPRAVHRELERLMTIGILHREQRGNRVYVCVNRTNPIVPELRAIFLKTVAIGDQIRSALADVEGVVLAFVYGSVAANTDTMESDVDLLIVGRTTLSAITPLLSGLEQSLGREINASVYSVGEIVRRAKEQDPFIAAVLAESRIFLIGTEEELRRMLND